MIINSISWKQLYLIYQVLYQSSGTNWSYHRCMKIVSLTEMALCVIVYMHFLPYFLLFTKDLQDLAVMNRISRGSNWARLKVLHRVCTFSTFFLILRYFVEEMKLVVLTDGINSNSWSWRPNNLKTHRWPCFSRIYGIFYTVSDRYL
jgi:hypothetical protein